MPRKRVLTVRVNGREVESLIEPRKLLADFIREDAGLTGTHVGCEHGVCGACTVLMNGVTVRSCLTFAVQTEGADIWTVEAMGTQEQLSALQQAFWEQHGLQCGFCTPGILLTALELLHATPSPDEQTIREALSGNLCRCTGYQNIVRAIAAAAAAVQSGSLEPLLAKVSV